VTQVNRLCELLHETYSERSNCREMGKLGTANKLFKRAVSLLRQLRSESGSEYAAVLSGLLETSDPELCVLVAADGLWEIPSESEQVLLKLSDCRGIVALSAYYTLHEWKTGRLTRPTEWKKPTQ
jgi:hypothetical protein